MGVYDRDYYRQDAPSLFANPTRVCTALIGANILLYVLQFFTPGPQGLTSVLCLDPARVAQFQVWRLITFAFVHDPANIWQIAINMIALYFFGREIETVYGPREFLLFYLVATFVCACAFMAAAFAGLTGIALGATAPVMAVLALCAARNPTQTVHVLFIPMTMWAMMLLFIALDILSMLRIINFGSPGGIVGVAFGLIYYRLDLRLDYFLPTFKPGLPSRNSPQLRLFRAEEEQEPALVGTLRVDVDEQLEAKLDEVLDKLNRFGQGSLTDNDRQILQRASEIYRRRRE